MLIVINTVYGGFSLSKAAADRYTELTGIRFADMNDMFPDMCGRETKRNDPFLIQVIRELRSKANGDCAKLKIVKIPDGVEWEICEYDGREWIAEVHRTWR